MYFKFSKPSRLDPKLPFLPHPSPLQRRGSHDYQHFTIFEFLAYFFSMPYLKTDTIKIVQPVNELVNKGLSCRDAHKEIRNQINSGQLVFDLKKPNHTQQAILGNLCNQEIEKQMEKVLGNFTLLLKCFFITYKYFIFVV